MSVADSMRRKAEEFVERYTAVREQLGELDRFGL